MKKDETKRIIERLLQNRAIEETLANGDGPWTVLSDNWKQEDGESGGRYVVLADPGMRATVLDRNGWDFSKGDGIPELHKISCDDEGQAVAEYVRYSRCSNGFEPLLIQQSFGDVVPSAMHVSEEFLLLMSLWRDPETGNYFEIKDDGSKSEAIRVNGGRIEVRTPVLRRYQAARQLDAILFTDAHVDISCDKSREDFPNIDLEEVDKNALWRVSRHVGPGVSSQGVHSRVLVKRILPPPPQTECGIWPYDEEDVNYPEFIIGEDTNGRPVKYTCNPDQLADYSSNSPEAPHHLTPVFFEAEVLRRYYDDPKLYNVSDGYLSCANKWGVQIDNGKPGVVSVFLGNLARIPSSHRSHWLTYNIPPTQTMSETTLRRLFFAEIVESQNPEHRFKQAYRDLKETWHKNWGWRLYREPVEREAENLNRVHIPLNDTNAEFERQILSLAILLVDLLNEKDIADNISSKAKEQGISKLERFLEAHDYPNTNRDIALLRKIQKIRSKGPAHASGSSGQQFLDDQLRGTTKQDYVTQLMCDSTEMLNDLASFKPKHSTKVV